ncbi:MAG: hypothetical protein ABIO45_02345 [Burkholderiaceae bacterium]
MFDALKRLLVRAPREVQPPRTPDPQVSQLLQKTGDSNSLSQDAKSWLVSIPERVWPKLICVRKAAVVNELADLWKESVRFNEYIDDLSVQPNPADMPPTYREELARLKAYRQDMRRNAHSVSVERRARQRAH